MLSSGTLSSQACLDAPLDLVGSKDASAQESRLGGLTHTKIRKKATSPPKLRPHQEKRHLIPHSFEACRQLFAMGLLLWKKHCEGNGRRCQNLL